MLKSDLLRALEAKIRHHTFDYFVDEPPPKANGCDARLYGKPEMGLLGSRRKADLTLRRLI